MSETSGETGTPKPTGETGPNRARRRRLSTNPEDLARVRKAKQEHNALLREAEGIAGAEKHSPTSYESPYFPSPSEPKNALGFYEGSSAIEQEELYHGRRDPDDKEDVDLLDKLSLHPQFPNKNPKHPRKT